MHKLRWLLIVLLAAFIDNAIALTRVSQAISVGGNTVTLQVPLNTRVEFLASISGARFPTFGPDDEMIVGTNGSTVYRLLPPYNQATSLVSLSPRSHSAVYRSGKLYVAAENGVYVADYNGSSASLNSNSFTRIFSFPTGGNHSSRTIVKDAAGTLYIAIGIDRNCTDQYLAGQPPQYPANDQRGGVWRVVETGANPSLVPYSTGLRNPIGIVFKPSDGSFWATNAGSDDLGNNLPREVFSRLTDGSWHGMPWFQYIGNSFARQSCISSAPPRPASQATPPSVTFDARSTPQGLAFVNGGNFSSEFTGNALVAIHGSSSSNRHPKIVMVKFSGGNPVSVEDVITGFQYSNGSRFARPSGAAFGADGHFYFTSDRGNVQGLFRLISTNNPPPPTPPVSPNGSKSIPAITDLILDDS